MNTNEILETINMIDNEDLDVRTITMGISLRGCADPNAKAPMCTRPAKRSMTRSAATPSTW